MSWHGDLIKLDEYRYLIPKTYKGVHGNLQMRTDGIIYVSREMLESVKKDNAPEQVANVATLPGIVGRSMAMPDIHWGYGFPIGGVAAMDVEEGIISPGGVGYDINCGVRLLRTNLSIDEVKPKIKELIDCIYANVPSGVGSRGKLRLSSSEIDNVMMEGAEWAVKKGYGWSEDIEMLEENGRMDIADSSKVSENAKRRGEPQLGTLGAGNHFLEIQVVNKIYEPDVAKVFGIEHEGDVTVMIHTGSRGFGHQICTDYLSVMRKAVEKYKIRLPDKQLGCAPVHSPEGESYLKAMACAANYAWTNRQLIVHWVRESFEHVFGRSADDLGLHIVYDVCHNIAKIEEHTVDNKKMKLCVHRKGATRAFPKEHENLPSKYRSVGQPVLIPGDMGSASYVLVGTEKGKETFYSTCHGAGRVMSRHEAIRRFTLEYVNRIMKEKGIYARGATKTVLREEAPNAYKNIDNVVNATHNAGISLKVAQLVPIGVMKG